MKLPRRSLLTGAAALAAPRARAAPGSVLRAPLATTPAILVPGVARSPEARFLGTKLYDGLLRWDANGPQPSLATAWEVSPDGLQWRFHLRPETIWHDSGGLQAQDVVFSLRLHRALQPDLRLERITLTEAEDAHTVRLTLAAPMPALPRLLDVLWLPILPAHLHDRPGWGLDPRALTPVGTGPFRMTDWLTLQRFEWFAGARPTLAGIDCTPGASPPELVLGAAIPAGALLRDGFVPPTAAPLAGLRLNAAHPPLGDARVRTALLAALDRPALVRDVWGGLGRPARAPAIPPAPDVALPGHDPRAASAALAAAGLRPDDDGIRLRLGYLQPPGAPWEALAAALRTQWGLIGIDLAVETVSAEEHVRRIDAGRFETAPFAAEQTGDAAIDLAPYAAELPAIAPLLATDPASAQRLLAQDMTRLWLVEPALPMLRDRSLTLPDGPYGSFAEARLG